MRKRIEHVSTPGDADPDHPGLDGYTSYEDGDYLVVCDRENPNAWIRSDETVDVRR